MPELLDRAGVEDTRLVVGDLRRINRWLGGYSVSRWALRSMSPPDRFTLLDVGAASSANGEALRAEFPGASVICLDRLESHLRQAAGRRVVADAFDLPFADAALDYVYCSLFVHHFSDDEVVRLLAGFARAAKRGVVVVDLERHWFARLFLPASRWLFGWHPITIHDGKLSVNAAFTAAELESLAARAGLNGARVARHFPWFRLSLVWQRR